ncbi:Antirestriction protein KlcA [Paraburkholderia tropica]|uniref:antirestriction protein n=1 Tax=Paraburkholderia tropica TaxID=92647 RepID=UPI001CAADD82|nr:antirestriction protein [Paraburkholderia tropica]CAG9235833.1 Antirestriction protein KlcA [Paraburkholderia tropica]
MNAIQPITATPVAAAQTLAFLPKHFGQHFMQGEAQTYQWAGKLSASYRNGLWKFFELSNDGFYLAPSTPERFVIESINGYSGDVSADAAGIIFTLFALNVLANRTQEDRLIEKYFFLREFALAHPEAVAILRAID